MSLTHYPVNLPGQIYGSPMPFGLYDPDGKLIHEYRVANISTVVVLAEADECRDKCGKDLFRLYQEQGFETISLPIPNYSVPTPDALQDALTKTERLASSGRNIIIHCSAGLGRTPLFVALLARRVLGLSGSEAIAWLSRNKPDALLTPTQILLLFSV